MKVLDEWKHAFQTFFGCETVHTADVRRSDPFACQLVPATWNSSQHVTPVYQRFSVNKVQLHICVEFAIAECVCYSNQ